MYACKAAPIWEWPEKNFPTWLKIHWEGKTYSTLFMAVICPFVTIVKEVVKVTSLYQIQLTAIFLNSCQGHRFFSPKYSSCPMLSDISKGKFWDCDNVTSLGRESVESGSQECKIQQIVLTGCLANTDCTLHWIRPEKNSRYNLKLRFKVL